MPQSIDEPIDHAEFRSARGFDETPDATPGAAARAAALDWPRVADTLLAGIEAAKPLFRDVIAEGNRDFRLFFSLSAGF